MDFSFFKSKLFIGVAVGIVLIAIVVIFVFGRTTIEIENHNITLWFNRMGKKDIEKLYQDARTHIERSDYDRCKTIKDAIEEYGGKLSFYSGLVDSHIYASKDENEKALLVLYDIYDETNSADFLHTSEEEGYLRELMEILMNKEKSFPVDSVLKGIEITENMSGEKAEEERRTLNDRIAQTHDLCIEEKYVMDRTFILREDAIKDAKQESLFYAKKEAPDKFLEKINELFDFEGILTEDEVLRFIRNNMVCDSSIGSLKRIPLHEEDTVEVDTGDADTGEFEEEIEMGWASEVVYTSLIKDFSMKRVLEFNDVELFEGE